MTRLNVQPCLVYILCLLGLLSGCTPPPPPALPTPAATALPAAGPTQTAPRPTRTPTPTRTPAPAAGIRVWHNLPEAQAGMLARDIAAFQKEFPRYRVALRRFNTPESFMPAFLAGNADFDLVLAPPVLLGSLWAGNHLAPMSDFFPPSFLDAFTAVALNGARHDGQLWGLPDTAGFHLLLFYNRDLVDAPPADTAAMAELARTFTAPNRQGLALNSYDPLWLVPWLAANGGWLAGPDGRPTLDTPAMVGALALYRDWHNPTGGITTVAGYQDMRQQFLQGKVAMIIDGEWAITELSRPGGLNWGVAPLPQLSRPGNAQPAAPLVLARYWAVSRRVSGNQAQAAAAFLEYITRPDRQLAWTDRFGLLPSRRDALNSPAIANTPALRVSAGQMQAGQAIPLGVNANTILDAMRDPLKELLAGKVSPQQAARMMQENIEP